MLNKTHINSGLWLFYREIISLVLKFVGTLSIIKIIGSYEYGTYIISSSIMSFLTILPQFGINVFLIKKDETYNTSALLLMCLISFLIVITCGILSSFIVNTIKHPEVLIVFIIMLFSVPFALLRLIPLSTLEKKFDFKIIAKIESESQFVFIIISIIFSLLHFGSKSCAIGFLCMNIFVFIKLFLKSKIKIKLKDINKTKLYQIIKFGLNYSQFLSVNELRSLILPFVVAPHFNSTIIGYIGLIDKTVDSVNSFSNIFRRLSTPILSKNTQESIQQSSELMLIQICSIGTLLFLLNLFFPTFIQYYMKEASTITVQLSCFICFSALCKAYNTIPISYLNLNQLNGRLSLVLILQYVIMVSVFFLSTSCGVISYGLLQSSIIIASICLTYLLYRNLNLKIFNLSIIVFIIISLSFF